MEKFTFITQEQQEENFAHYTEQIKKAQNTRQLGQIARIVITQQQKPNGNFFFEKGKSKEFWEQYKQVKAELVELDQQEAA